MPRYVILTFAFLFFAHYEMSGGSDFEPGQNTTAEALGLAVPVRPARSVAVRPVPPAEPPVAQSAEPVPEIDITLATLESQGTIEPPAARSVPEDAALDAKSSSEPKPGPRGIDTLDEAGGAAVDPRRVNGSRVNLRAGPGTGNPVLTKLDKGDLVEVLEDSGDGWLSIRVPGTGVIGWMADFLVTAGTD